MIISPRNPTRPLAHAVPVDPALFAAGDHNGATFYQHQGFLDCIRTGRRPDVTLRDGAQAVAMGRAAQRSAQTGQAVSLD